jgi:hypothetical protein
MNPWRSKSRVPIRLLSHLSGWVRVIFHFAAWSDNHSALLDTCTRFAQLIGAVSYLTCIGFLLKPHCNNLWVNVLEWYLPILLKHHCNIWEVAVHMNNQYISLQNLQSSFFSADQESRMYVNQKLHPFASLRHKWAPKNRWHGNSVICISIHRTRICNHA